MVTFFIPTLVSEGWLWAVPLGWAQLVALFPLVDLVGPTSPCACDSGLPHRIDSGRRGSSHTGKALLFVMAESRIANPTLEHILRTC